MCFTAVFVTIKVMIIIVILGGLMGNTDNHLTTCEKIVMKVVWDAEGDIKLQDAIQQLKDKYGKDYARTTVATFLKHLEEKGYVHTYRVGRIAYIHAEEEEKKYLQTLMKEEADFWFEGSASKMLAALIRAKEPSKEEITELRNQLAGLDN